MNFSLSDEQKMLCDTVGSFLRDRYNFDQRRSYLARPEGRDPAIWKALATEIGILGAAFSEELGGFGGGNIDNMLIMRELGKALVVEPYLETVVIGGGLLKHSNSSAAAEFIAGIIAGEVIIGLAHAEPQARFNEADLLCSATRDGDTFVLNGTKVVVVGAPWASHLIVTARTSGDQRDRDGVTILIVDKDAPGITLRSFVTVDGRAAADVHFDNVRLSADAVLGEVDKGLPLLEQVLDEAVVALCGEACGVIERLQTGTVEFSKDRRQFGVPISSFQVLQHRMVDMFIAFEQSVSMTYMAAIRLDDPLLRAANASIAKAFVSQACMRVGEDAVQIHGGMGVTDEMAIAHYFKRATMIASQLGGADFHFGRYERLCAA